MSQTCPTCGTQMGCLAWVGRSVVPDATERLHRICDALSEQADESPFTREEWDAVDKQTVRLTNALKGLIEAIRSIEVDKVSWDTSVAKPLESAYRALKHEDPVPTETVTGESR